MTPLPLVAGRWPVRAAMAVLLATLTALLAWQYLMPEAFDSLFKLNHPGVQHFRDALGVPRATVALGTYTLTFRALMVAAWIAYLATLLAAAMGSPLPPTRTLVSIVVGAGLVTAVLWPPSFSCDVYGYVAYGRLQVLYGLNPYGTSQKAVLKLGDPTGPFLVWGIRSPYGPLWTTLSVAVVWLLRASSLFAQIVAMKLIGAVALVGAALGGRQVAKRLAPERADLTLLAIGLNPLFLMEGPGNAHNDLVMVALVIAALGAALASRPRRAVLWAGVAGAIKFLPLLLVPWIVLSEWRAQPRVWSRLAREAAGYALAALLPITLTFVPYWLGPDTMRGLWDRYRVGQIAMEPPLGMKGQAAVLMLMYGAATAWVLRGDRARMLLAWVGISGGIALLAAGIWLPWYLSWAWLPALVSWDRRSAIVSYASFCFAVVLTLRYSVPL